MHNKILPNPNQLHFKATNIDDVNTRPYFIKEETKLYTTRMNKALFDNSISNNPNVGLLIKERKSFKELKRKFKSIACIDIFFDAIRLKDSFISNFSDNSPLDISSIHWSLYILHELLFSIIFYCFSF